MKKKVTIFVLFIALILIVGFIFSNSAKFRNESTQQSVQILSVVLNKFAPEADAVQKNIIHNLIRKSAHVIEYMSLGIMLALISRQFENINKRKYICFPLFIGLSVGVIDEFIQSFNDRSAEVQDVIIDFSGVFVGVALVMIIFLIKDSMKKS